jgi:hypothetical protein
LIVDFTRMDDVPRPEQLASPEYLMNFLPEETWQANSPLVLSPADGVDLAGLIQAGWGKDAVIGVYSDAPAEDVLARLRAAPGVYVRPSLAWPQLTSTAPVFADNVFAELLAVLVEGPSAEQWNLVGRDDLEPRLQEIGLTRQAGDSPGKNDPETPNP